MLDLFSTEQINEAKENAIVATTKHTASIAKKTLFASNIKLKENVTASAKADFILHVVLLNDNAIHISNCKSLCEMLDLKYSRFFSHVHDASYKKSKRLADFLDVDALRNNDMLQAIDKQQLVDLFLLQATQEQYKIYVAALYDFMSENVVLLAHDAALSLNVETVKFDIAKDEKQAIRMNKAFDKKAKKEAIAI